MTDSRTVLLDMDAAQQSKIRDITGAQEFQNALGYLSTWNMTFPRVTIVGWVDRDGRPELSATYYREDSSSVAFALGAVWSSRPEGGGSFSFHS